MLSKAGESLQILWAQALWFCFSERNQNSALVLAMTKCATPELAGAQLLFHPAAMTDSLIQHSQQKPDMSKLR